jgi:hypothetical protein
MDEHIDSLEDVKNAISDIALRENRRYTQQHQADSIININEISEIKP